MSDEGAPVDVDGLVERMQAQVEQRRREGQYPAELLDDLDEHFRRVSSQRSGPDVHMLRVRVDQLEHAAHFSAERIPLESSLPGGAKLHAAVAKAVSRQTNGILTQMQQFADAVVAALQLVLAEVDGPESHVHAELVGRIDALYEMIAAMERGETPS